MRRLIVLILAVCCAAAATMALGSSLGPGATAAHASGVASHGTMHMDARPVTLAQLNATFRGLLPATRCDAGDAKRASAVRLRAAALKGAAKATPKVLQRKKTSMRRAIALLRSAKVACAAPPAPGGGGSTPPPGSTPAPPGTPPTTPPLQTVTLHVAAGPTFAYTEASATARAGAMRLSVVNGSTLMHFIGVRVSTGQPTIAISQLSDPGETKSVDVTLAAGTYELFCNNNNHDTLGMKIPLTVTP